MVLARGGSGVTFDQAGAFLGTVARCSLPGSVGVDCRIRPPPAFRVRVSRHVRVSPPGPALVGGGLGGLSRLSESRRVVSASAPTSQAHAAASSTLSRRGARRGSRARHAGRRPASSATSPSRHSPLPAWGSRAPAVTARPGPARASRRAVVGELEQPGRASPPPSRGAEPFDAGACGACSRARPRARHTSQPAATGRPGRSCCRAPLRGRRPPPSRNGSCSHCSSPPSNTLQARLRRRQLRRRWSRVSARLRVQARLGLSSRATTATMLRTVSRRAPQPCTTTQLSRGGVGSCRRSTRALRWGAGRACGAPRA